nr:unnamed protein product [Callosobruchus chinensis]
MPCRPATMRCPSANRSTNASSSTKTSSPTAKCAITDVGWMTEICAISHGATCANHRCSGVFVPTTT